MVEPHESTSHFFLSWLGFCGNPCRETAFRLDLLWTPFHLDSPLCACARCSPVLSLFRRLSRLGMPEMLKPTSLIIGAGLSLDVACLTDGRFSGGYVDPSLFPSHTLVAALRAYPVPTFFHVLSEYRKHAFELSLFFIFHRGTAPRDPRHMWDRPPSHFPSFVRLFSWRVDSISAGR